MFQQGVSAQRSADLQPAEVLGAQRKVVDAEERPRGVVRVQQQQQLGHLKGRRVQALPAQPLHTQSKLLIMQRHGTGSERIARRCSSSVYSVAVPCNAFLLSLCTLGLPREICMTTTPTLQEGKHAALFCRTVTVVGNRPLTS